MQATLSALHGHGAPRGSAADAPDIAAARGEYSTSGCPLIAAAGTILALTRDKIGAFACVVSAKRPGHLSGKQRVVLVF